jgi:hypothetical protein
MDFIPLVDVKANQKYSDRFIRLLLAMPPMLSELSKDKSLGCLSYEMLFKYRGAMIDLRQAFKCTGIFA